MNDTFTMWLLTDEMTRDEGREPFPYTDTRGYLSIGIGRNLTGKGLSSVEIDFLFDNDVEQCCDTMDKEVPWWRQLPPGKQRVMINLCFMGWEKLSTFHHFLAAMEANNWHVAADELRDSLWYKEVRERGPRVVARLLAPDGVPIA